MPQLLFAVAVGVAAYAGFRWAERQLGRAEDAAAEAANEAERAAGMAPKDLGALEWDESAGAYRPKRNG